MTATQMALEALKRFTNYPGCVCGADYEIARRAIAALEAVQVEPVAWMTHHDEPMLFLTEIEAAEYCDDDERPIPLYATPQEAKL